MSRPDPRAVTAGLKTKSDKFRALAAAGYSRAEISRIVGVRYQFVRNVLTADEGRREAGVAEAGVPFVDDRPQRLRVGAEGRVVIPALFREALGIAEGAVLYARLEDGGIRLYTGEEAIARARASLGLTGRHSTGMADELIAERRADVQRDEGGE
jgi:bifunctional DNA-binding transcriptional regulator/antitoxin component of YhaV-PrlF toxin-antitoxin module